jgi:hypothetical protein
MLLPNNGRIVIIDDNEDQAIPLIKALSKNKIPCTFHSEKEEDLPVTPYEDIRVLFLDINLTDSTDATTIRAVLIRTLQQLIKPGTPYVLAIWSVKEDLVGLVLELFTSDLKTICPLVHLQLRKSDFFDYEPESGKYNPSNPETLISDLSKRLSERFQGIDAFEAIIKWENLVNNSTSEVIRDIKELAADSGHTDLNESFKTIFFKLAEAMWGRQLKGAPDLELAIKAAGVFNNLLVDQLEFNINSQLKIEVASQIKEYYTFSSIHKAKLNTKLLLSIDEVSKAIPGNAYELNGEPLSEFPCKELIANSLNIQECTEQFFADKNGRSSIDSEESYRYKNKNKREYEKFEKQIRTNLTSVKPI